MNYINKFEDIITEIISKYNYGNDDNAFNHVAYLLINPGGKNIFGKNDLNRYYKTSIHAEVAASKKFILECKYKKYKIRSVDILVIRISKNGNLGSSRPCSNCIKYMYEMGFIRNVYYSTSDGAILMENLHNMYLSGGKTTKSLLYYL
jgi:cytidine deaminase